MLLLRCWEPATAVRSTPIAAHAMLLLLDLPASPVNTKNLLSTPRMAQSAEWVGQMGG